jgi:hypothetical protein
MIFVLRKPLYSLYHSLNFHSSVYSVFYMSYVCISLLASHNYHRWYGLQIAREGDVYAVQRFLNRVPDYSDMDNMFRAAVRFRVSCYAS